MPHRKSADIVGRWRRATISGLSWRLEVEEWHSLRVVAVSRSAWCPAEGFDAVCYDEVASATLRLS